MSEKDVWIGTSAPAARTASPRVIDGHGTLYHRTPIAENADTDSTRCTGPLNPYAASKFELDQQMRTRHAAGLDWIGLRYTNVFGLDESDKGPMASILSQLLRQAAGTGHIRVFADSLTAARDYVSVESVTTTILHLATTRLPVSAAVYNLGTSCAVSFAEIAQWCARLHREATSQPLHVELVPNPVPSAYQYFTCADMTALDKALSDRPTEPDASVQARAAELFTTFRSRATG
ncbi:NAD-dependent epimerase/dehydratase family protein [Streptomyces sp. NBC_01433]|uniref:NAD-dependent epimerase/dehydratase family protein n=1 Tax=Streptomyces sp. NBC_01433 TaxID=2903864 RepID=UPI00224C8FAD|nr:NAD-dependent epimerase/dehydratase family protein [Streptomyces sp. NBC_01433]MCX4682145.1 NAD-dependent epimerase/dehydratase family protein [Streptomyces sp. NBC_01433]